MNNEQEEAYTEKLRLLLVRAFESIQNDFKSIPAQQSAKGALRSGDTIRKLMTSIHESHSKLFFDSLEASKNSFSDYSPKLEEAISSAVDSIQKQFIEKTTEDFKKACKAFGRDGLFDRIENDFTKELRTNKAEFQSDLRHFLIHLKKEKERTETPKVLLWLEAVLVLSFAFVAGMWLKDPNGNYEPILALLGAPSAAIPILLKIRKKNT